MSEAIIISISQSLPHLITNKDKTTSEIKRCFAELGLVAKVDFQEGTRIRLDERTIGFLQEMIEVAIYFTAFNGLNAYLEGFMNEAGKESFKLAKQACVKIAVYFKTQKKPVRLEFYVSAGNRKLKFILPTGDSMLIVKSMDDLEQELKFNPDKFLVSKHLIYRYEIASEVWVEY